MLSEQQSKAVVSQQELRAKGQMPPMRGQTRFHDDSKDIAREVPINDAPPPIRYNLTKRSVQDDIQRRTNTIVVIKGRYQAPGTLSDDQEGALRLRIMPGNVGPVSLAAHCCKLPLCKFALLSCFRSPCTATLTFLVATG